MVQEAVNGQSPSSATTASSRLMGEGHRPHALRCERISTLEALDALGPAWDELQDRSPEPQVLMDHRWVRAWWHHFGAGKAQHTMTFHDGQKLVGIVPLVISRGREAFPTRGTYAQIAEDFAYLPASRPYRFVPIRRLSFPLSVAAGNLRGGILAPGAEEPVCAGLGRYVAGIAGQWDLAVLEGLLAGGAAQEALSEGLMAAGLAAGRRKIRRALLWADLPASMDQFLRQKSSHFRKRLRQECRKIERDTADLGGLRIEEYRKDQIDPGLEILFGLEAESWKATSTRPRRLHLQLDDRLRGFHREVAHAFAAGDRAQIIVLSVGAKPAMALFNLERGATTCCYLTYRSEQLAPLVSIAPIWSWFVETAIARGLRHIDFNGYTRNVRKWAVDERVYLRTNIFNDRPYSRLLRLTDDLAGLAGRVARARSSPPPGDGA